MTTKYGDLLLRQKYADLKALAQDHDILAGPLDNKDLVYEHQKHMQALLKQIDWIVAVHKKEYPGAPPLDEEEEEQPEEGNADTPVGPVESLEDDDTEGEQEGSEYESPEEEFGEEDQDVPTPATSPIKQTIDEIPTDADTMDEGFADNAIPAPTNIERTGPPPFFNGGETPTPEEAWQGTDMVSNRGKALPPSAAQVVHQTSYDEARARGHTHERASKYARDMVRAHDVHHALQEHHYQVPAASYEEHQQRADEIAQHRDVFHETRNQMARESYERPPHKFHQDVVGLAQAVHGGDEAAHGPFSDALEDHGWDSLAYSVRHQGGGRMIAADVLDRHSRHPDVIEEEAGSELLKDKMLTKDCGDIDKEVQELLAHLDGGHGSADLLDGPQFLSPARVNEEQGYERVKKNSKSLHGTVRNVAEQYDQGGWEGDDFGHHMLAGVLEEHGEGPRHHFYSGRARQSPKSARSVAATLIRPRSFRHGDEVVSLNEGSMFKRGHLVKDEETGQMHLEHESGGGPVDTNHVMHAAEFEAHLHEAARNSDLLHSGVSAEQIGHRYGRDLSPKSDEKAIVRMVQVKEHMRKMPERKKLPCPGCGRADCNCDKEDDSSQPYEGEIGHDPQQDVYGDPNDEMTDHPMENNTLDDAMSWLESIEGKSVLTDEDKHHAFHYGKALDELIKSNHFHKDVDGDEEEGHYPGQEGDRRYLGMVYDELQDRQRVGTPQGKGIKIEEKARMVMQRPVQRTDREPGKFQVGDYVRHTVGPGRHYGGGYIRDTYEHPEHGTLHEVHHEEHNSIHTNKPEYLEHAEAPPKYREAHRDQGPLSGSKMVRDAYGIAYPNAKELSPEKAEQMLHDGEANGHPLTEKQRRYFGAVSNRKQYDDPTSVGSMPTATDMGGMDVQQMSLDDKVKELLGVLSGKKSVEQKFPSIRRHASTANSYGDSYHYAEEPEHIQSQYENWANQIGGDNQHIRDYLDHHFNEGLLGKDYQLHSPVSEEHQKALDTAIKFFFSLVNEKAIGQRHRDEAKEVLGALSSIRGAVAKQEKSRPAPKSRGARIAQAARNANRAMDLGDVEAEARHDARITEEQQKRREQGVTGRDSVRDQNLQNEMNSAYDEGVVGEPGRYGGPSQKKELSLDSLVKELQENLTRY